MGLARLRGSEARPAALQRRRRRRDTRREPATGPGLHGTGLDATSYGRRHAPAGDHEPADLRQGQPFTVAFTNQGENDEFNVKVTLKISGARRIADHAQQDRPAGGPGEKTTVELPLNRQPPVGSPLTIEVNVAKVPGEKTVDNNKSSYPTLFAEG